jgi:hypothetical protein
MSQQKLKGRNEMKNLWVKWRINIVGWLAVVLGVSTAGWFGSDGKPNYPAIGIGLLAALVTFWQKDKDVTGGTVAMTREAEARTTPLATLPPMETK